MERTIYAILVIVGIVNMIGFHSLMAMEHFFLPASEYQWSIDWIYFQIAEVGREFSEWMAMIEQNLKIVLLLPYYIFLAMFLGFASNGSDVAATMMIVAAFPTIIHLIILSSFIALKLISRLKDVLYAVLDKIYGENRATPEQSHVKRLGLALLAVAAIVESFLAFVT